MREAASNAVEYVSTKTPRISYSLSVSGVVWALTWDWELKNLFMSWVKGTWNNTLGVPAPSEARMPASSLGRTKRKDAKQQLKSLVLARRTRSRFKFDSRRGGSEQS